jgi:hypothetical protein
MKILICRGKEIIPRLQRLFEQLKLAVEKDQIVISPLQKLFAKLLARSTSDDSVLSNQVNSFLKTLLANTPSLFSSWKEIYADRLTETCRVIEKLRHDPIVSATLIMNENFG